MKKLCFINVWIGPYPDWFDLWKKSALANDTIDFYLISDNEGLQDEKNIHYIYKTFSEIKSIFEREVGFKIALKKPYKLCDYRALWPKLISDEVSEYEYWGHVDLDVIYGDLRHFLTEEMFEKYDKILDQGNLTIYKNSPEINEFYKASAKSDNMAYSYKRVFKNNYSCYFDEFMGMSILWWQKRRERFFWDQDKGNLVMDFGWQRLNFQSYITGESHVACWKEGKLYQHKCDKFSGNIETEGKEILLMHIQKRKMEVCFDKKNIPDTFWIVPNRFVETCPNGPLYSEQEMQSYAEMIAANDKEKRIKNLKENGIIKYLLHRITTRRIRKWIAEVKKFY